MVVTALPNLATSISIIKNRFFIFYFCSSEADNKLSPTHGEGEEATQSTGLVGLNQTSYNLDIADIISYSQFDPDTTSGYHSFVH